MPLRLQEPCMVVLVGPSSSGKSTWAAENFRPSAIVSSDRLRGVVGASEDDQTAGGDAFELLDLIVQRRVARGLTTVIDTLGLNDQRRAAYLELTRSYELPCYAAANNAATVADPTGRFRQLADAGVDTETVVLPDLGSGTALERFRTVIEAFR